MKASIRTIISSVILLTASTVAISATCPNVTSQQLTDALKASIKPTGGPSNGGLDFHMWATVVSTDDTVCMIVKSGDGLNDQWLGSRTISAQKATTAILFSTPTFALSTANLYASTQPGGSLFGLQFSNPVNPSVAYLDDMTGHRVGGVNVFGGGLALYDSDGKLVGAVGVSGDTSCADHNIAWRVRKALGLDHVPAGVSGNNDDNIIYDDANGGNNNGAIDGFEHVDCGNNEKTVNQSL